MARVSRPSFVRQFLACIGFVAAALLVSEIGLRLAGDAFLRTQRSQGERLEEGRGRPLVKVLLLGDSIASDPPGGTFELHAQKLINSKQTSVRFQFVNYSKPGTTTFDAVSDIEKILEEERPDLVMSLLGAVDSIRPIPEVGSVPPFSLNSLRIHYLLSVSWTRLTSKGSWFRFELALQRLAGRVPCLELADRMGMYFDPGMIRSWLVPELLRSASTNCDIGLYSLIFGERLIQLKGLSGALEGHLDVLRRFPNHYFAKIEAGRAQRLLGRNEEAERLHRDALLAAPKGAVERNVFELAEDLRAAGKLDSCESALKEGISRVDRGQGHVLYFKLIETLESRKKRREADAWRAKLLSILEVIPRSATIKNYRTLADKLDGRGIPLIAIQYPLQSVQSLKANLEGSNRRIVFIDNERNFLDALRSGSYTEIFSDMDGSYSISMNHLTPLGHRLIAENVVETLLGSPALWAR